jgi:hypothetical protein
MIRLGARQWEIYRQGECEDCRLQERLRDRFAARQWLQQFKGNAVAMNELRNMLSRSTSVGWRMDRASDDEVVEQAAQLLSFGAWHVHGLSRTQQLTQTQGPGSDKAGAEDDADAAPAAPPRSNRISLLSDSTPKPPAAPAVADKLTWIEIELLNTDGKPVAGVEYEIEFPDGSVQKGTLDSNGKARYDQIKPGQCQVRFPGLHAKEWLPA